MACETREQLLRKIMAVAKASGQTIGTAESCTGGLICGALTDIPGSSAVVRGGIVSYAVPVKEQVLGVPESVTQDERIGVVSAACAEAMCEGARRVLACDVAVSTTGIAGPGGAEPGKPVGTVWFGVTSGAGTRSELHVFEGDRSAVRDQAVTTALSLLLTELEATNAV